LVYGIGVRNEEMEIILRKCKRYSKKRTKENKEKKGE
jgi:hypothetical protein